MNGNDSFDSPPEQLALSYELLYLIRWLVEHEQEALKDLMQEALAHRQQAKMIGSKQVTITGDEELQYSIVDFFGLLDALLFETMQEESMSKAMQKNLMPSITQIDSSACDDITIQMSLDSATAHLDKHPEHNAKDVLYEELLKQWEPDNQTLAN